MPMAGALPVEPGQAAFAAIAEIVATLMANLYRPSEILLMLQGGKRSDEWTVGRQHQAMDGEA